MFVWEFAVLSAVKVAAEVNHQGSATAKEAARLLWIRDQQSLAEPPLDAKGVGYVLRRLAKRGLVETAGRRHGGAHKWTLTAKGYDVVSA